MKKPQGPIFLAVLVPAALAVAALVYRGLSLYAVGAGTLGVLLHWLLSGKGGDDGELADSSYFFGFLLTLTFLAVGLYNLGAAPADAPAGETVGGTTVVLRFLQELAAGLTLTIVGLVVRQVRTLSGSGTAAAAVAAPNDAAELARLANVLDTLAHTLRSRPEEAVAQELVQARSRARNAVEELEQGVSAAAKRMTASIEKLEDAATTTMNTMVRTGSGMGEALAQITQRIQAEVAQVLSALEQQRRDFAEALTAAQQSAAAIRLEANEQMQAHSAQWRATLEQARTALAAAHSALDAEYQRGLAGFARTGSAFAELSERAARDVEALPNPAERLTGLWDGVNRLELTLTQAIEGSARELTTLRERSLQLTGALAHLTTSADSAAGSIEAGGARLGEALLQELKQMNGIIEEYTSLLETTTRSFAVRR